MAVVGAFMITSLPFVLAEAGTGAISLATGQLSMPPLIGTGTLVDSAILATGLLIALVKATGKATGREPAAEPPRANSEDND